MECGLIIKWISDYPLVISVLGNALAAGSVCWAGKGSLVVYGCAQVTGMHERAITKSPLE